MKKCDLSSGRGVPSRRVLNLGAVLAVSAAVIFFSQAAMAQRQTLYGHIPAAASQLRPIGEMPGASQMNLVVGLPLRNKTALTNLLAQIYDPANANYHHYLTPAQFAEQFGPRPDDYQAVLDFVAAHGLRITGTHPNRTLVDVQGTVADIENTLHLHLRTYQHPTEARTFFAPDAEPSVDLAVPLLFISGLNSYTLPHPLIESPSWEDPLQPRNGSGSGGSYIGSDFRHAYVPGTSLTGAGQSVGLWEGDGYVASDIASYEAQAGLPAVPLVNVYVDGATGQAGSGASEVSLDIEMTIAMAPGLASVIVYEGPDEDNVTVPNDILNRMATDNSAKQLSCSWGFSIDSATDQIFQQYAAQGQSFFLASGDSGAFVSPNNPVEPPSDDPYITVVGATTLSTSGPGGTWQGETVWNWYTTGEGKGASSGGISPTYSIPSWQAPVSMAQNQGSTTMRNLPDVAMVGDNVWVIYGGGQSSAFGGTSCAAPLWAGFTALVNEQGANNLRAPVGFVNPAIYSIGLGANYGSTFHDITTGNNTNTYTHSFYFAVPGYDLCTGWGSPASTNLINLLSPPSTTPILNGTATLVNESCLPTNGAVDPGETVTVNLQLTDFGVASTTNLVATLQPSPEVLEPSGPEIFGVVEGGGSPVSRPFTFTAGGVCGQTISAIWQLQDGTDNLGTVTVNFSLGALVPATTFSQDFDSVTPPALPNGWSNLLSGQQIDWVTTTAAAETGSNSVFATDVAAPGVAYLVTPAISILSSSAQLSFQQNYNLESGTTRHHGETEVNYYDGGVLEIAIGNGAFNDIISAGGSFVEGGYVGTLYNGSGNPLAGRAAWSGDSGGWVSTIVTLPAAAAGQTIQLRWGCATDQNNLTSVTGWYVDTVSIGDASRSCCNDTANLAVTQTASPSPFVPGQTATYTLTVSNAGPDLAADVVVTDALPANVSFVSAPTNAVFSNGEVIYSVGNLAAGASVSIVVAVTPTATGTVTNTVYTSSITLNTNAASGPSVLVTAVGGSSVAAPVLNPANAVATTNGFSISVPSAVGQTYILQYKNSLSDPSWINVPGGAVAGTGGTIVLQDNSAEVDRFYRVVVQ